MCGVLLYYIIIKLCPLLFFVAFGTWYCKNGTYYIPYVFVYPSAHIYTIIFGRIFIEFNIEQFYSVCWQFWLISNKTNWHFTWKYKLAFALTPGRKLRTMYTPTKKPRFLYNIRSTSRTYALANSVYKKPEESNYSPLKRITRVSY
jgi:hypothetical protein